MIAVDMFLNLVTTNPGEVKELLDNLLPAVVGVFVVYLPLLVLAVVNISKKGMIVVQLQHRVRRWALEIAAVGLFCILLSSVMRLQRITGRQAEISGLMPGASTMLRLPRCM